MESHVVNPGSNGGAGNALYRQNSELIEGSVAANYGRQNSAGKNKLFSYNPTTGSESDVNFDLSKRY